MKLLSLFRLKKSYDGCMSFVVPQSNFAHNQVRLPQELNNRDCLKNCFQVQRRIYARLLFFFCSALLNGLAKL